MGKFLLYIAIAFSVVTALLGIMNKGKLSDALADRDATKSTLTAKEAELGKSVEELKQANEKLAGLSSDNEKTQKTIASVQSERDQAKSELESLQKKINDQSTQIADLKEEVASKQAELEKASTATQQEEDPSAELKTQLAENQQLLSAAQTKLSQAESELTQLRAQAQDRARRAMRDGLEGSILAVNPAYNFVVLNLGDRNGVVSNSEMLIKRGNVFLGKVRITSVEPSTSIADIVANSVPRGLNIQPGDHVIYRSVDSEIN